MANLKIVFCGMGGNSFLASQVYKDIIDKAGYDLVMITEWANADVKWNINTWPEEIKKCDVVFCPQRIDIQPAKSSIKAISAMALGLPVVASRIKSYEEIIKQGENGYIFDTKEDLYNILMELKDDKKRKSICEKAKESVKEYTVESISDRWVEVLNDVLNNKIKKSKTKVDVKEEPNRDLVDLIIPNYNNLPYLKMLLNSILLNTDHPYHIIISDSGSNEDTWKYLRTLKGMAIIGDPKTRKTFSEACNDGIVASRTKYFMILNSDLIVSKGWLTNIVEKMNTVPRLAACGVLSNCDRGWLHSAPGRKDIPVYDMRLPKSGIELVPGMKKEQIEPHIEELYTFMDESNKKYKGKFIKQPWVATYATIFARCAITEIGVFDTIFKNGCEDLDLMIRLIKGGYTIGQSIDSFVFHFGGISRLAYQTSNREEYNKEDVENHLKIYNKWVFTGEKTIDEFKSMASKPNIVNVTTHRKKIAIWTGPAWEPWNKQKVDEGMAGSETWAAYLSEEFVKKGYETRVYNDLLIDDKSKPLYQPVEGTNSNVIYRDHTYLLEDLKYDYFDYFISSRSVQPFYNNLHVSKKYVMIHDIWLSNDPNMDILSWQVQKYAYLSKWHKDFLRQHHKQMPEDKMFMTANGVNQDLYKDVDSYEKKNKMVYSSSPDRGLYQLLTMLPFIRERVPDFEVVVLYGFFNWKKVCESRNDTASLDFIKKLEKLMEQPGVNYLGRVDKKTLAHHQKESKVWLMPEWFSETFSITAVECGLAKNALLSTDYAGLSTIVGKSGILLPYPEKGLSRDNEYTKEYNDRFIEESIKLLTNEEYRLEWADKAYNKMKEYTWSSVADGWLEEFKK